MYRAKIVLSYDGSQFYGSQIQNNSSLLTVNGTLENAFKKLNIQTSVMGSGRTDKDVHATHQVIHVDIPEYWSDFEKLKKSLNLIVSPNIYIKSIHRVSKDFHARFSAKKRLYRYILNTKEFTPFSARYSLHVKNIDVQKLDNILQSFQGIHNFEFFKKHGSDNKNDTREIFKCGAYKYKDFIVIYFQGNSFLRSQVRMMVQFALDILDKKFSQEQLKEQLNSQKRYSSALVAPYGLYLSKIYY